MKKFALLAVVAVAAVGAAMAGNALATGEPTIVAEASGFTCGVFDANGNIFITTTSDSKLYANGKEVLHCIGQGTGNGTVVYFSGFACGMVFTGISTDPLNKDRVSKSGESQLWCYGHAGGASWSGTAGAQG
jgi:hypothetical protein